MTAEASIDASPEWAALAAHHDQIADIHLRELFARDPGRATRMVASAGDLVLDYSKHRVTEETMRLLLALGRRAKLAERRNAMFAARHINSTEDRAVLHVALRMARDPPRTGRRRRGLTGAGRPWPDGRADQPYPGRAMDRAHREAHPPLVNIGIGGSDLGPAMAYEALKDYAVPDIASGSSPTSTASTCGRRPTTSTRETTKRGLRENAEFGLDSVRYGGV
ncbi:MAG: hypothetical protein ACR2IP_12165 [Solirubrobacteraceae bacterium]